MNTARLSVAKICETNNSHVMWFAIELKKNAVTFAQ